MHMLTDKQILENLARHQTQTDVSAVRYFRSLQKQLADQFVGRRRIYLDTKYWVLLRDAALGRARSAMHTEILGRLRTLVSCGLIACPLSDAAYVESMQQTDKDTRLATAALMDELSGGLAIATEETRVRLELLNFMTDPCSEMGGLNDRLWVKCGFVLGENVPHVEAFDTHTNLIAQKSFIDLMWHQTIADFAVKAHSKNMIPIRASAARINEELVAYADHIRSFKQAVAAEFSGCVKQFNLELAAAALREKGYSGATSQEAAQFQEAMQTALYNALRLRPDFMAKRVPTLFIHAMCHPAIRWDKCRKLDSHWLLDIHHACAALPYHDAMFTEHPLRILLQSGNMRMEQRFGTRIFSAEADVLQFLADCEESGRQKGSS